MQNHVISFIVAAFLVAAAASAKTARAQELSDMPSGSYELDLSHASIVWKVSHFGFSTYPGRFTSFDVDLNLNTQNFTASSVTVTVDPTSIQTAYPNPEKEDFDSILANDWFLGKQHPEIKFVSSSVSELDGNSFTVNGELSLLGKTAPVTLQAVFNKATQKHPFVGKPVIGFSAKTTIDRTQWGLSKYAPGIGADVAIEIEGEFFFPGE